MQRDRTFKKEIINPSKEELARLVRITVEKLDRLLFSTQIPLSMQQPVWADQDTTFQEVTPDTRIGIPDVSVAKQLMRQHVHNLLSVLSPKERKIIRLRFGIEESKQNFLSEIGNMFGLSKERVR
ncbi:hypothetical protein V6N13_006238 [Hibiscus sabdariffa]|uniref:RNA polymerase sigma-70 region 4 domain-containing protein n=1 Tax=Hibiscus sabdariffa TaxID=183260 RepID=A0ABR2EQ84_9ROSI